MRAIVSRNPFTGKVGKTFPFLSKQQLTASLNKAEQGFLIQKQRTVAQRASMIAKLGQCIEKHLVEASKIVTGQTGKPITQAEGEVKKAASFCKYYSEHFEPILPTQAKSDAKKGTVVKYLPMGIVYYLVPFNYPFYLNFKGGLPNLLLGNTLLTRNADSCPLVGEFVEKLMHQAGFSQGEYQNVYTSHEQIDQIFSRESVAGVSFTGSSKAGAVIAEKAGKYLKKAVMELGGNDPFVVLSDANVKAAVETALRARCTNAGQVCFSPKRFIIAKEHYAQFKDSLIEGLAKYKFGDPSDPTTQMGPLARPDLYDNLQAQLAQLPHSYKITYQRSEMKRPFFPITLIEGSSTEVYDEELFGPVYQLFKAEDEAHAIRLANSGTYGLAATVFSENRGEQVIDQIRSGMGFVNEAAKSDTPYPSGGVGRSGFGRECGLQGYRSFANIKTHFAN